MASTVSRRDFLRASGLAAGGLAGLSLFGAPLRAGEGAALVGTGIFLDPSSPGRASTSFVRACERVLGSSASLERTLARLSSDRPVRLYGVDEAETWLRENGYLDSLEYFVRHGGRHVVLFEELNVYGEPQFSADPRTLAYLAHRLRERELSVLFPGPAATTAISSGTWLNGLREYFVKYDLLGPRLEARTLGQVYHGGVDPAVADRTMLWHSGRGLFAGLVWHDSRDNLLAGLTRGYFQRKRHLAWVRDHVDPSLGAYIVEASRPVRVDRESSVGLLTAHGERKGPLFQSSGPFRLRAA